MLLSPSVTTCVSASRDPLLHVSESRVSRRVLLRVLTGTLRSDAVSLSFSLNKSGRRSDCSEESVESSSLKSDESLDDLSEEALEGVSDIDGEISVLDGRALIVSELDVDEVKLDPVVVKLKDEVETEGI